MKGNDPSDTGNKQSEPHDYLSLLLRKFPGWGTGNLQTMASNLLQLRKCSRESEVAKVQ